MSFLQDLDVPNARVGAERNPLKTEVIYYVNDLVAALPEWRIGNVRKMAQTSTVTDGSITLAVAVGSRQFIADRLLGKADLDGKCPDAACLHYNVQKRLGNRVWVGGGQCRCCGSFLDPQLEHAETCSNGEATRGHHAYVHAVVCGMKVADRSITTEPRGVTAL